MKHLFAAFAFAAATVFAPAISQATPVDLTLNASDDGSVGICGFCPPVYKDAAVIASFGFQGIVKFSSASFAAPVEKAVLSLNAYSSPQWGMNVDIYGYGTSNGVVDVSDVNAGVFLGKMPLPYQVTPGQEFAFDVTDFVKSINSPYIAFNLRNTSMVGADLFTSMRIADPQRHGSQLLIDFADAAAVPEPGPAALVLAGLLAFGLSRRRSNSAR